MLANIGSLLITGRYAGDMAYQSFGGAMDSATTNNRTNQQAAMQPQMIPASYGMAPGAAMGYGYGQVNAAVPAAVAFNPGYGPQQELAGDPNRPNRYWTNQVANERGSNAQEMYANYMRGEGREHVADLMSARENAPDGMNRGA